MTTSLILIPGFWLGAWAWDDVVAALPDGFDVHALTLPGLEPGADRAGITRADHVRAVTDLVDQLEGDVVLVGHSGGGALVGEVVDRRPDRIRRAIYVDSGPLEEGATIDPSATEQVPLPAWDELEAQGSSIEGIDEAALAEFRRRAVPHPGEVARGAVHVSDPRRFDVPATVICTSLPSEVLKTMAHGGPPFHTELGESTDLTYVDLPTGHWPMFSRPADLAEAIATAARG
ncbi:alpha/beta fold hydrolase [Cellulomonas fengjieae]|uniref:alpha/beta fold hydrolase n=1 Tax=Cellulomonas fengjieae TaxID=2819978 RepID=UPI001AAE8CE7|nr:alpha/beta hydrolase [Cellulomonas fengjieae]MBO3102446.1 alpha/beta hydrolase [Cellulomonas fengjieae]